jgi:hypothetical protein
MTLAEAMAKASTKDKNINNTGINQYYDLQSSKYFYSTGHTGFYAKSIPVFPRSFGNRGS